MGGKGEEQLVLCLAWLWCLTIWLGLYPLKDPSLQKLYELVLKTSGEENFREDSFKSPNCFTFIFGLARIGISQQIKQSLFFFLTSCVLDREVESGLMMSSLARPSFLLTSQRWFPLSQDEHLASFSGQSGLSPSLTVRSDHPKPGNCAFCSETSEEIALLCFGIWRERFYSQAKPE